MRSIEANRFIGARLRQERLLAGKSREELGSALGVGPEFIHAYERGATRLPAKLLVMATEYFGLTVGALFYIDDGQYPVVADEDTPLRLGILRPSSFLRHPDFAQTAPTVKLWQETHGELTDEVARVVTASGLFHRMILVRQKSPSRRLITEHFGSAIKVLYPCKSLYLVGRDLIDQPDREYGTWIANAYDETLRSHRPRIEACRALVRTSTAMTLSTRYDRVLIPWHFRQKELFVMCLSIQREVPVTLS